MRHPFARIKIARNVSIRRAGWHGASAAQAAETP